MGFMKLPIGYSDFKEIIDDRCYFVDKTLMIKDIIDDAKILLITRPRRFGKTLNLSMLRYFFEKNASDEDNSYLFNGLAITKAGEAYTQHQGKYPVIFISFKDVKDNNFAEAYNNISVLLSQAFSRYSELLSSDKLLDSQKEVFCSVLEGRANKERIKTALQDLTQYLSLHYNAKPIVLIDEYDTPIQASYINGYYDEMVQFMRGFLSAGLKDNIHLHKGVLTGILRVAKENIFPGLNNLKVYTLLDNNYSRYFGFTEEEVLNLLHESKLEEKADEIQRWYNGYQFGEQVIYNPWSIINCVSEQGKLVPYWVNTSDNTLIKDLLANSDVNFKDHFELLLAGKELEAYIDPNIIYSSLQGNETSVWTLLLMSGYLKVTSCVPKGIKYVCSLHIPNREVLSLYDEIVTDWLFGRKNIQWYSRFLEYLRHGEIEKFARAMQEVVLDIFSYHDAGSRTPENFYHGFVMGLIASLRDEYYIDSNRESGFGRYDLAIIPKTKDNKGNRPAIP